MWRRDYANGYQPWIWSQSTGVINLGDLTGGNGYGRVAGISNNGTVIGWFNQGPCDPNLPFIWTPTDGVQELNNYITQTLGYTMGNTPVYIPNNMSENGKYITGWGYHETISDLFTFRLELPDSLNNNHVGLNQINLYPNPTEGIVNINSNVASLADNNYLKIIQVLVLRLICQSFRQVFTW